MLSLHVLSVVVGLCQLVAGNYVNDLDQPVDFQCPKVTQTISKVHSVHDNGAEDRRFEFECRDIVAESGGVNCAWSANYENALDKPLYFECNSNGYINGMHSEHDDDAEDRRWKFNCCSIPDVHMYDCEITNWTNDFDKIQDYTLPTGMAMKGALAEHDNGPEDRRYRYEICKMFRFTDCQPIVG